MNEFTFFDWREYREYRKAVDMDACGDEPWTEDDNFVYTETIENNLRWEQEFFEKREYAINPYMKPLELPDEPEDMGEVLGGSMDDED